MDQMTRPDPALEVRLQALAEEVRWPPTPDSLAAATTRLRTRPVTTRPSHRRRLVVLAVAALLVLAAAGAVALGGLSGLRFVFTDSLPSPRVVDDPWRIRATLGRLAPLEEARTSFGPGLLVPDLTGSAAPDEVYLGSAAGQHRVALVYLAQAAEPALHGDIGMIVTEWAGELFDGYATKWLDRDRGTVEPVEVRGTMGYWFSGMPHVLEFLDVESGIRRPITRLVGNVLVWQDDGVIYRIETPAGRDAAIAVAESMR
jgi:hypothetical protein